MILGKFRRMDIKFDRADKLVDHKFNELKRLKKVQTWDNINLIYELQTVVKVGLI